MKPVSDTVPENKIPLKWSERGQLIAALSDIKQVHTNLVESRRNLKNKEQFRVICMTLGSLEIFLLGTGPDPVKSSSSSSSSSSGSSVLGKTSRARAAAARTNGDAQQPAL